MFVNVVKIKLAGGAKLVPRYPRDVERMDLIQYGEVYRANMNIPPNMKLYNKFQAMLAFVVKNSERWLSENQLLVSLKDKLQLIDFVAGPSGRRREVYRSFRVFDMTAESFVYDVYRPAVPLLAAEIGMDEWEFETLFRGYD